MSVEDARILWHRFTLTRLFWMARRPCDRCRPGMPCDIAQQTWLLVDAASIDLDLAVAEASRKRIQEGIA